MKRPRRLLAVAVILSTLLCAGCVALWVRSHWAYDAWSLGDADGRTETGVVSSRGRMMAWRVTTPPPEGPRHRFAHRTQPGFRHAARRPTRLDAFWFGGPQTDWNRAGFGYYARDLHGAWWRCLFLPWWALCVLTALPAMAWVRLRFWPRRPALGGPDGSADQPPAST
jgi:hypothetical protein